MSVSREQVKAARLLLDWTREGLADQGCWTATMSNDNHRGDRQRIARSDRHTIWLLAIIAALVALLVIMMARRYF